jgi:hypothetical protein
MSENANQTTPRSGTDNGNSGHYEQGGRRNNPSGNRNNRRRRPSQPYGGQAPGASSQREPIHFGPSGQPGGPSARPQNSGNRPDPYLQNRNVQHDQRPCIRPDSIPAILINMQLPVLLRAVRPMLIVPERE